MLKKSTKIKKLDGKTIYLGNFDGSFELVLKYQMDFLLEDMLIGLIEKRLGRKVKYDSGCLLDTGERDVEIFMNGRKEAKVIAETFDLFAVSNFGHLVKVKAVEIN